MSRIVGLFSEVSNPAFLAMLPPLRAGNIGKKSYQDVRNAQICSFAAVFIFFCVSFLRSASAKNETQIQWHVPCCRRQTGVCVRHCVSPGYLVGGFAAPKPQLRWEATEPLPI